MYYFVFDRYYTLQFITWIKFIYLYMKLYFIYTKSIVCFHMLMEYFKIWAMWLKENIWVLEADVLENTLFDYNRR